MFQKYESRNEKMADDSFADKLGMFFLILLFGVLIVIGTLSGITNKMKYIQIHSVVVSGSHVVPNSDVIETSQKYREGACFWYVSCNTMLTYDRTSLAHELLDTYPRLKAVKIGFSDNTLTIELIERSHDFVWCLDDTESQCWFLDKDGIVVDRAPKFSPRIYLVISPDTTKIRQTVTTVPARVLEGNELSVLSDTLDKLQQTIAVEKVLYGDQSYTLAITSVFDKKMTQRPELYIARRQLVSDPKYRQTMTRVLLSLQNFEPFRKPFINDPLGLEYLDMRLGGKLYFRFAEPVPLPRDTIVLHR